MEELLKNKNKLLIELEKTKLESHSRREIESVASKAAVLETQLAAAFLFNDRKEDAVVSIISAASCLSDARREEEAKRLLHRARMLTGLAQVQQWIDREIAKLANKRLPAAIFDYEGINIVENERLRIPQREAYLAARLHFSRTTEHAVIQLPVGCGKTGTMAILPFGIAEGRTLVVTPNLEINRTVATNLDASSNASFYRRTGVLRNGAGPISAVLSADANIHDCDSADFIVTNIQQLVASGARKWLDRFPSDYFDMILVDEGHHNVASSWTKVFDRFPKAKITSFTATPLRSDGKAIEGKRIYRFPIATAIREGYVRDLASRRLQPTELHFIHEGTNKRLTLKDILKLREEQWFSKGVALARECNEHIVDASIQCMNELRSGGEIRHQIIAAACSIDHAKAIRSLYAERGYSADVIHSDMQPDDQERIRRRISSGEMDAIVQVQMLGEGADYPTLGVAAVFRPYRHMVPYVQFIGRVMRVAKQDAPGHPDNRAYVVSHVGLNVDRWWDELKKLDEDDQTVFEQLLHTEREFTNPLISTSEIPRRRFRPPMEVLQDVVERFLEVGFIESDANALVDDVIHALQLRGVSFETLGLSRDDVKNRLLQQSSNKPAVPLVKTEVLPQRRRQQAQRRLDERVRAGAKELLNELGFKIGGRQLFPLVRQHNPSNNLAAAIILINLAIQKLLRTSSGDRGALSLEELETAYSSMDEIIDNVAESTRATIGKRNNG
jgi:DNA repair protein RadD